MTSSTAGRPLGPEPSGGVFAGTGGQLMQATVYLAAVPANPPPELATAVEPVHDRRGALVDWRLAIAPHKPAGLAAAYRSWRSGYARDFLLGERGFIRAFLAWAQAHGFDLDQIHLLRLPSGHLDRAAALKAGWHARHLREQCAAAHGVGFGILAAAGHAPVRSLIPTDPPTPLLATPTAAVAAGPGGVHLTPRDITTTGWQDADDGLEVTTSNGTIRLARAAAATYLLRRLGRGAPQAYVQPMPLARLAAPLLIFLADAAQLAGDCRTGLTFWTGQPQPVPHPTHPAAG